MTRLTKPDVIPQLVAANEVLAISWLGEFSQQQITKSLEASKVSTALLCDAGEPKSSARTGGLFSGNNNSQASQSSACAAAAKFG